MSTTLTTHKNRCPFWSPLQLKIKLATSVIIIATSSSIHNYIMHTQYHTNELKMELKKASLLFEKEVTSSLWSKTAVVRLIIHKFWVAMRMRKLCERATELILLTLSYLPWQSALAPVNGMRRTLVRRGAVGRCSLVPLLMCILAGEFLYIVVSSAAVDV